MSSPYHWSDPMYAPSLVTQAKVGLIDLHLDSILQHFFFRYDIRRRHRSYLWGQPAIWHADIPRMSEAGYGGACMGIHSWPWENRRSWNNLERQIHYLDTVCRQDTRVYRIRSFPDWEKAQKTGGIALAAGVEGAHMVHGELGRVAQMAKLGVTYLTLAHFSKNSAATPSMGRGANEKDGLTSFGRSLVQELNQYGIAVDVAHVNTPGVLEACKVSGSPVFCTHTGVKGLHKSARNITDDEIDAIADTGGVVGIIFSPHFLTGKRNADSRAVIEHLEYVVQRVGIDHVALGSDYDGWLPAIPSDHKDCRDIVRITYLLQKNGYSDTEVAQVLRGNAMRVLKKVWEKRDKNRRP